MEALLADQTAKAYAQTLKKEKAERDLANRDKDVHQAIDQALMAFTKQSDATRKSYQKNIKGLEEKVNNLESANHALKRKCAALQKENDCREIDFEALKKEKEATEKVLDKTKENFVKFERQIITQKRKIEELEESLSQPNRKHIKL